MRRVSRAAFPLLAQVPDVLRGVILDFHWNVDRLHALCLPEREVSSAELAWHLELPFWADGGRPFQVSPAQVAADPGRYRDHWDRTLVADLSYRLDGYLGPGGRVTVLDGVHRLLKAAVVGRPTMRIGLLQEADFDAIALTDG